MRAERCSAGSCPREVYARGRCEKHYHRWYRLHHEQRKPRPPQGSSLAAKLDFYGWDITANGCWEFRGIRTGAGYGRLGTAGAAYAHRVAHERANGPIPAGLLIRHTCDNPPCVNPAHLLVGTPSDNSRDAVVRGRWRNQYTAGGAA